MQWCGKDLLIFTHHSHITSNGKTRGRRVHFKPIGICFEIQYHICRGSQVQLGKVYNTAVFHSELHHDSVACLMVLLYVNINKFSLRNKTLNIPIQSVWMQLLFSFSLQKRTRLNHINYVIIRTKRKSRFCVSVTWIPPDQYL